MNRARIRAELEARLTADSVRHASACAVGCTYTFNWRKIRYEPVVLAGRIRSILRRLRICPICRGTGRDTMHRTVRIPTGDFIWLIAVTCPRCKGTGRID